MSKREYNLQKALSLQQQLNDSAPSASSGSSSSSKATREIAKYRELCPPGTEDSQIVRLLEQHRGDAARIESAISELWEDYRGGGQDEWPGRVGHGREEGQKAAGAAAAARARRGPRGAVRGRGPQRARGHASARRRVVARRARGRARAREPRRRRRPRGRGRAERRAAGGGGRRRRPGRAFGARERRAGQEAERQGHQGGAAAVSVSVSVSVSAAVAAAVAAARKGGAAARGPDPHGRLDQEAEPHGPRGQAQGRRAARVRAEGGGPRGQVGTGGEARRGQGGARVRARGVEEREPEEEGGAQEPAEDAAERARGEQRAARGGEGGVAQEGRGAGCRCGEEGGGVAEPAVGLGLARRVGGRHGRLAVGRSRERRGVGAERLGARQPAAVARGGRGRVGAADRRAGLAQGPHAAARRAERDEPQAVPQARQVGERGHDEPLAPVRQLLAQRRRGGRVAARLERVRCPVGLGFGSGGFGLERRQRRQGGQGRGAERVGQARGVAREEGGAVARAQARGRRGAQGRGHVGAAGALGRVGARDAQGGAVAARVRAVGAVARVAAQARRREAQHADARGAVQDRRGLRRRLRRQDGRALPAVVQPVRHGPRRGPRGRGRRHAQERGPEPRRRGAVAVARGRAGRAAAVPAGGGAGHAGGGADAEPAGGGAEAAGGRAGADAGAGPRAEPAAAERAAAPPAGLPPALRAAAAAGHGAAVQPVQLRELLPGLRLLPEPAVRAVQPAHAVPAAREHPVRRGGSDPGLLEPRERTGGLPGPAPARAPARVRRRDPAGLRRDQRRVPAAAAGAGAPPPRAPAGRRAAEPQGLGAHLGLAAVARAARERGHAELPERRRGRRARARVVAADAERVGGHVGRVVRRAAALRRLGVVRRAADRRLGPHDAAGVPAVAVAAPAAAPGLAPAVVPPVRQQQRRAERRRGRRRRRQQQRARVELVGARPQKSTGWNCGARQ